MPCRLKVFLSYTAGTSLLFVTSPFQETLVTVSREAWQQINQRFCFVRSFSTNFWYTATLFNHRGSYFSCDSSNMHNCVILFMGEIKQQRWVTLLIWYTVFSAILPSVGTAQLESGIIFENPKLPSAELQHGAAQRQRACSPAPIFSFSGQRREPGQLGANRINLGPV